jgi:hypothetical protein
MAKNPQSLSLNRFGNQDFYAPAKNNSQKGQPLRVQTNDGIIIKVVKTGSVKYAEASTGQQTTPEPFVSSNLSQNLTLINQLLSTYFPLSFVTNILEQEPAAEEANKGTAQSQPTEENRISDNVPLDLRLVYLIDDKTGNVLYSLSTDVEKELVDGFMIPDDKTKGGDGIPKNAGRTDVVTSNFTSFYGVPAIMSEQAYINLQAAGGKGANKLLVDRANQPRFYDNFNPGADTNPLGPAKTPTTTNIINWSTLDQNKYKFPYKYQDFVFCKWWQKIPNNYMVTLRRYPYPVSDAVTSPQERRNEVKLDKLYPVATMVTFLGEDSGNKISAIVGPIETGLKWKDIKADVWEVTQSTEPATVNNPAPGLAKVLGFMQAGAVGSKTERAPMTPVDPYNNGPYVNKILGPVNVITSVKGRERGLEFKHEINLVFEYSIRSIGGINTKAAGLDILANALLMTSASAPFWGGMNRFAPHVGRGDHDPFLGGDAGRAAWLKGDPNGFFNALKEQFTGILGNISDLFSKITADPIGGLKEIAGGAAKEFMKLNTTEARGQISGLHALLTGAPTGEWHLQVGSPLNPLMMIGNLICSNAKIEFNDELGPDDFPTELKITITLEHGMPRDKNAIESMFNYGQGRIYALPKGYEQSLSANNESNSTANSAQNLPIPGVVGGDKTTGSSVSFAEAGRNGQGSRRALVKGAPGDRSQRPGIVGGEKAYEQTYSLLKLSKDAITRSAHVSLYGLGNAITKTETPPAPAKTNG